MPSFSHRTNVWMLISDELAGFEEAWKGNVKGNFPGWDNMHGNAGKYCICFSL